MTRETTKLVGAVLCAVVLGGLGGCASTSEVDKLRGEIDQINQTARNAAAAAQAARTEAAAASQTAAEARAAAQEAKAAAQATDEKVDRMFKKAMYK